MEDKKGYLILGRRQYESIIIGDVIEIAYLGMMGYNQARIGVRAPKDVVVHRKEIWERAERQKNAGPHLCAHHAVYSMARTGMRIAACDMCGNRWGIPDEAD